MFTETTFYLSRIIGKKVVSDSNKVIGSIQDVLVDVGTGKPQVIALKLRSGHKSVVVSYTPFTVTEEKGQYIIRCRELVPLTKVKDNTLFLKNYILDRQIVDIDGRKLVRVNDLRLAVMSTGTFLIAVDVGLEGLLRRLGVAKPLNRFLRLFKARIPSQLILWDQVETVDIGHAGIKLSKAYSKLETLHVSDLADIIEDMDAKMQAEVFSSLNDEKAADVLEELETEAQIKVLGSLPVEKAADLLEMMPADEAADILEELSDDRAEELLSEMETESSDEVRELMEYEDDEVGSIMSTDFISYKQSMLVSEVLAELRTLKPESSSIYYLYVVDDRDHLIATVSLRDIVVSEPNTSLTQILNTNMIFVRDTDEIGSMAEIISKYNLLAIPVVDKDMALLGTVIIDDIVYNLLRTSRRRRL